jgi:hypothetical protein
MLMNDLNERDSHFVGSLRFACRTLKWWIFGICRCFIDNVCTCRQAIKKCLQTEKAQFFIEKSMDSQWICRRCRCYLGDGFCFSEKTRILLEDSVNNIYKPIF